MSNGPTISRRTALIGTAAAAGVLATGGALTRERTPRFPTAFIPHGGGPWPFVDMGIPQSELEPLATYLRSLPDLPPEPPRALLVVSAHWEEPVPTVMTSEAPDMLFDYYGFPDAAYELQWPAPGSPVLAERVRELLGQNGFETAEDPTRGYDHGAFVPLMLPYPEGELPVVQLSLKAGLDPVEHLAMGRALAPLRDEGVFIIGSGMSFHNMRALRNPALAASGPTFDRWLQQTITASPAERADRLANWASAPAARAAHPREEHLLPLMLVAGAAMDDVGVVGWSGHSMGWKLSAAHFG